MSNKLTYDKQEQIIKYCIRSGEDLSSYLDSHGLSYDDLVYKDKITKKNHREFCAFVPVESRPKVAPNIPCVSFFSGAGGLDIGFECAGFHTLVDVEIMEMFCNTLRANGHSTIIGPPSDLGDMNRPEEIISKLKKMGIPQSFPGVFHGGPPCQSFSIAANQRFSKEGENFKRTGFNNKKLGNLLFCYIQVILYFKPETFLIENVDGLLTIDGGLQVKRAVKMLTQGGYDVTPPRIINAADYGVPQNRMRTIIVGSRVGHFDFPPMCQDQIPSGSVFFASFKNAKNHITRKHSAESIGRYMILGAGKRDKLGRVDRLDPTKPSKTIIAGGTGGGGRSHLHPYIPRTMSVRECARLQTFPDSYIFTGPVARQFTQVGNAVPPVLAYEMACAIYFSIYSKIQNYSVASINLNC